MVQKKNEAESYSETSVFIDLFLQREITYTP
jgi:hypothetical protein